MIFMIMNSLQSSSLSQNGNSMFRECLTQSPLLQTIRIYLISRTLTNYPGDRLVGLSSFRILILSGRSFLVWNLPQLMLPLNRITSTLPLIMLTSLLSLCPQSSMPWTSALSAIYNHPHWLIPLSFEQSKIYPTTLPFFLAPHSQTGPSTMGIYITRNACMFYCRLTPPNFILFIRLPSSATLNTSELKLLLNVISGGQASQYMSTTLLLVASSASKTRSIHTLLSHQSLLSNLPCLFHLHKQLSVDLITDLPFSHSYDLLMIMVNCGLMKGVILVPCLKTVDTNWITQLFFGICLNASDCTIL